MLCDAQSQAHVDDAKADAERFEEDRKKKQDERHRMEERRQLGKTKLEVGR